eukprot:134622_1
MARTATRFCVDANIEKDEEIDMANFILAARYLGTAANDDQLMDVFVEMEEEDGNKSSKQMIKDLMQKVEEEYGKAEAPNDDHSEIFQIQMDPDHAEDAQWQQTQIDDFLISQQEDHNLAIAKNLLETTALTRHEVAQITGVSAEALKDYESDEYDSEEEESDFETDSEEEDEEEEEEEEDAKKDEPKQPQQPVFTGVKIVANKKSVVFSNEEVNTLKSIVETGDNIKEESEQVLILLQKLRDAVNIAPGAMKRAKTLAKLALSGDGAPPEAVKKEEKKEVYPMKYRVVISPGALCKLFKDKTSAMVGKIAIGEVVTVAEVSDGRARISHPLEGWCSLVSSRTGAAILQRVDLKSHEMNHAVRQAKARQTKIVLLKSVTTLNDKTVETMLEKCNWNLRVAIDSFMIAKYKTQQHVSGGEKKGGVAWFKSWKKFANPEK